MPISIISNKKRNAINPNKCVVAKICQKIIARLKLSMKPDKTHFIKDSINMFNSNNTKINTNRNRHLSLSSEIRDSNLPSSTSREKTNFLLKGDNKTFSFRYLEKAKTINPKGIQIIQAIFRAFLYRKNFFKNKSVLFYTFLLLSILVLKIYGLIMISLSSLFSFCCSSNNNFEILTFIGVIYLQQ